MKKKVLKVVLAAGSSKRYGIRNKIVGRIKKKRVIEIVLNQLIKANGSNNDIIIITGYNNLNLRYFINKFKIKIIYNKKFKSGLASSVSLIHNTNLNDKSGIMFIPGDMPLISKTDYFKLFNAFLKNKNKIISPSYLGKIGNPIIIPKIYFKYLKNLTGDEGVRKKLPKKQFKFIPCSIGTVFDIDTKMDLQKAIYLKHRPC